MAMQRDEEHDASSRFYPASFPAALPASNLLREKWVPPPAPRRRPSSISWVVPPLNLPMSIPVTKGSRAGSSTRVGTAASENGEVLTRSCSVGEEDVTDDGVIIGGPLDGCLEGPLLHEEDEDEEDGIFQLDGGAGDGDEDEDDLGLDFGGAGACGLPQSLVDDHSDSDSEADVSTAEQKDAKARAATNRALNTMFAMNQSDSADEQLARVLEKAGYSWSIGKTGSASELPLGTSPILQLALQHLAAVQAASGGADDLSSFGLMRQSTI